MLPEQQFSTGLVSPHTYCKGHLAKSRDIFGCDNRGRRRDCHLVGRGQGCCCTSYNFQGTWISKTPVICWDFFYCSNWLFTFILDFVLVIWYSFSLGRPSNHICSRPHNTWVCLPLLSLDKRLVGLPPFFPFPPWELQICYSWRIGAPALNASRCG